MLNPVVLVPLTSNVSSRIVATHRTENDHCPVLDTTPPPLAEFVSQGVSWSLLFLHDFDTFEEC